MLQSIPPCSNAFTYIFDVHLSLEKLSGNENTQFRAKYFQYGSIKNKSDIYTILSFRYNVLNSYRARAYCLANHTPG